MKRAYKGTENIVDGRVELLAPCGSYESFLAAVNAGADAVYLGGKAFGARAYAENFSEEELVSVIRQAHLSGVRVYLTVNTLIKEREFSALYDYILPFYEAGLDGAIVQDMGVFSLLKRDFPDLKLHASTQMTVTGIYGAAYLKELGCERIVPARELSLKEIRAIRRETAVEIEAFIHGAMCYCYSGQCLMSSMIGGRSGNRGRCAGPCRLPYKTAGREGYYLSLKDMNTLEHIPELIEAGIDSFKIEGRMKKPEYVAGVVSIYRKYIDKYYTEHAGRDTLKRWSILPEDRKVLSSLYIRSEAGNGYYDRSRGKEMLTLRKPGYNEADPALLESLRKTYIKEIPGMKLRIFVRCRAGEPLYGEVRFSDRDTVSGLSASGPVVEQAKKRAVCEEEIRGQMIKTGGTPFVVEHCEIELGENTFVPVQWLKQLRRELLRKIYIRYGARDQDNEKNTRSEGRTEEECISDSMRAACKRDDPGTDSRRKKAGDQAYRLTTVVQTREQFAAVFPDMEKSAFRAEEGEAAGVREYLIVDADLFLEDMEVRERISVGKVYWGIKCPLILRQSDRAYLQRLQSLIEEKEPDILYCGTIDVLAWAKGILYRGEIAGEASLYAWNREAVLFWAKELDCVSVPLELDSREIRELSGFPVSCGADGGQQYIAERLTACGQEYPVDRLEAPVYGRAPFMVSANCVKLSSDRCDRDRRQYAELTDRMGNIFPVYTNCSHCYNIIYNCLPTSCHESLWMLQEDGIRSFRIEFTVEDGQTAGDVRQTFRDFLASELQRKDLNGKEKERKDFGCGIQEKKNFTGKARREKSYPGTGIQTKKKESVGGSQEQRKVQDSGKLAKMKTTQGRFGRSVE